MPIYNFECQDCRELNTFRFASVSGYVESQAALKCTKCESTNITRTFSALASNIKRDKETILQQAMEDKNRIVEKIKNGDAKTIRNIYGEEK